MRLPYLPLAIAAIGFAAFSCNSDKSQPDTNTDNSDPAISSTEFVQELIRAEQNYEVADPDFDTGKYFITLSCDIQWPSKLGDYNIKPLQDTIISTLSTKGSTTIRGAVKNYLTDLTAWDSDAKPIDSIPSEDISSSDYPNAYYGKATVSITELTDNYLTVNRMWEQFAGAAHPMYSTSSFTYAYPLGKMVSYDFLFKPDSEAVLLPAITSALVEYCDFTDEAELQQMLLVKDVPVTTNVSIQNNMIVFQYNIYEILPYSCGAVAPQVAPYQVREALTPEAIKFFGLDSVD